MHVVIAMPVYEDWESALELCHRIDLVMQLQDGTCAAVLLIDDGSQDSVCPGELPFPPRAIEKVTVLQLRRNVGHQRAIAIGLTWLHQHQQADAVVVMDADGEDRAEDIPRLLRAMEGKRLTAVFAERGKRLETVAFRTFYTGYRIVHRLLTGRDIRFGNFSVLPWSYLDTLVVCPDLWNHYAATLINSRLTYARIRIDRGRRIAGASHMNFVSLVVHGLAALFANQELVGTRMLILVMTLGLLLLVTAFVVVAVRLATNLAVPGWATGAMGTILVLLSQALTVAFVLISSVMVNRSSLGFVPIRDYGYFVRGDASSLFER